jgi:secreted PhoX family phosphatase
MQKTFSSSNKYDDNISSKKIFRIKKGIFSIAISFIFSVSSAQFLPQSLDTNFTTNTLIVAPGLVYDTLFTSYNHYVYNAFGDSGRAKQNMDFIGLEHFPYNGKHMARITVNQETTNIADSILGDGGGQTTFEVEKVNGAWQVVDSGGIKFRNIDFIPVGYTNKNCGGGMLSNGNTMSCEEFPVSSNLELFDLGAGFKDTSDFIIPAGNGIYSGDTLKRWQNMGWVVQTDPANRVGLRKLYGMGRFSHEFARAYNDSIVYLTNDDTPAALFKFIATSANDFTNGTLYTYKQTPNGLGTWIALPNDLNTMLDARNVAFSLGASIFIRLEGCAFSLDKTKLYFSETGGDSASIKSALNKGATYSSHLMQYDTLYSQPADSFLHHLYGNVMQLDLQNDSLSVLIHGGNGNDIRTNLSSPDNIDVGKIGNKEVMAIQEDLIAKTFNRLPDPAGPMINEIYLLDMSIDNPTVDDLIRFAIAPDGSETSGGVFAKDTDTYFVNVMHPNWTNPYPFNNSVTVAIRGLYQYYPAGYIDSNENQIQLYPNPSNDNIHLSAPVRNAKIYDENGRLVFSADHLQTINMKNYASGIYFLTTDGNGNFKFIVQ